MSRLTELLLALLLAAATLAASAAEYSGIGRTATPKEIAAWDIDVRADFKGLPKGAGTVARGQEVWEGKCASCHGVFGESNSVFMPIVGGTTRADIASGRVAALASGSQPQRTTIMKVPTLSTLWDYINRAMPWDAPKSLTHDEVYAVTAFILNLAEVVADDFTLSDKNMAKVQKKIPNRNGMTSQHGMWDVKGKPDVQNIACMTNCPVQSAVSSFFPVTARGISGNLAEQNRTFGPVRGLPTLIAGAGAQPATVVTTSAAASASAAAVQGVGLANKYGCVGCHGMTSKIIGPGFNEITARYKNDSGAQAKLEEKIKQGGGGVWGPIPMPAQSIVSQADIKTMVQWILSGN